MAQIEIHIVTYNEQIMLPFTIAHYRKMFGDPIIVIHDNGSTDNTLLIAAQEKCQLIPFETKGMNDDVIAKIKTDAALNAVADWVLCIDADEECLINSNDLDELNNEGIQIVEFDGWNIFDEVSSPEEVLVPRGCKDKGYSKPVLLKTGVFKELMFAPGAHKMLKLTPASGNQIVWSKEKYKLLHYKHWSCEYNVTRSAELAARQSEANIAKRHSFHFAFPASAHREHFKKMFDKREIIVDKKL
jgi:Glycosyl transferase family 2